jgi:HPt (histidine-containing phosphotransfer) domain-containing protein
MRTGEIRDAFYGRSWSLSKRRRSASEVFARRIEVAEKALTLEHMSSYIWRPGSTTPDAWLIPLRAPGDAYDYGLAMPTNAPRNSAPQTSIVPRATSSVDVERFRADLREGGVEEMLALLLDTFVHDCPARLEALERAVKDGSAKAIESAAHAFKSGAGTVRATVLADCLREVEAASRGGNLAVVRGLLEHVRTEYLAVLRELETAPRQ